MRDMKLSDHFWLSEFTESQTASRYGFDNTPGMMALSNLIWTAANMEEVRRLLGNVVINISSGFRCLDLNRAIHSKDTSAHVKGLAADFTARSFGSPPEVCLAVHHSNIEYDQLIFEHTWTHLAFPAKGSKARKQVLTLTKAGGYVPGIVET